ncbi:MULTISPECIES: hypothetical protein [Clostridium]|uniref:hypothetical protein n=1 Tax=Clostridium TaxID=1485 RepID=UPI0015D47DA3|nr:MULTISPECIES: hypothetical protein [Clostridium]MDU4319791.1 hypothetical protein [Clostridium sp.]
MSKTNKELVSELTSAFITSWNSKEGTMAIGLDKATNIFNTFKKLVESMDDKETK